MRAYALLRSAEALELLGRAHALLPTDPNLAFRLSEAQRASGKYAEAEKTLREALKRVPDDSVLLRQLGHVLMTSEKKDRAPEAEAVLRKALSLQPDDVEGLYWLAIALDAQGKPLPEVLAAWKAVAAVDVRFERTAYLLGRCLARANKKKEAEGMLGLNRLMEENRKRRGDAIEAMRQHPGDPTRRLALARLLREGEEYGSAIALLRRSLHDFPAHASVAQELRRTLSAAGRKTEAARVK
jgi:cytochrome c-type biogenesis protein CcmH/NrfG